MEYLDEFYTSVYQVKAVYGLKELLLPLPTFRVTPL